MPVSSRLKATKIIGQKKAFYRPRIPGSSCSRKETVDIDILVTSTNGDGDRKIMQFIRIKRRPFSRERKWKQFSQSTSTKVIPLQKTKTFYILMMSQVFKRGNK